MKTILSFGIACFLSILLACNSSTEQKSNNSNVSIVKEMYNQFNNHDWDAMAKLYADSAEFKDPSFGIESVNQNRTQIAEKYKALNEYFPDIKDSILNIYESSANVVVVEFISTGTAVDGNKLKLPICTIFTIENGLITKDYTYYDNQ